MTHPRTLTILATGHVPPSGRKVICSRLCDPFGDERIWEPVMHELVISFDGMSVWYAKQSTFGQQYIGFKKSDVACRRIANRTGYSFTKHSRQLLNGAVDSQFSSCNAIAKSVVTF